MEDERAPWEKGLLSKLSARPAVENNEAEEEEEEAKAGPMPASACSSRSSSFCNTASTSENPLTSTIVTATATAEAEGEAGAKEEKEKERRREASCERREELSPPAPPTKQLQGLSREREDKAITLVGEVSGRDGKRADKIEEEMRMRKAERRKRTSSSGRGDGERNDSVVMFAIDVGLLTKQTNTSDQSKKRDTGATT